MYQQMSADIAQDFGWKLITPKKTGYENLDDYAEVSANDAAL